MVGDLAKRIFKVGIELTCLVSMHQVLEGIENRPGHLLHLGIMWIHQRQLLLEHQCTGGNRCHNIPALINQFGEHWYISLLSPGYRLKVTQFQLGHAAALLFLSHGNRDAIVLEHRHQVLTDHWLVAVPVAGGKQRHLAFGWTRGLTVTASAHLVGKTFAQGIGVILRYTGISMDTQRRLQNLAGRFRLIGSIDDAGHHRDTGQAAYRIGTGKNLVARPEITLFVLHRLGPQHQVREIEIPLMGRCIGTLGHVAEITEVAVVDYLPVVLFLYPVNLEGIRFIHQIEQGGKRLAQAHTATTTVAEIKDPFQFLEQRLLIEVVRVLPINGVAGWRLQIAFSCSHDLSPMCLYLPTPYTTSGNGIGARRGDPERSPQFC